MTILSTFGGTSGPDTGDIGHALRWRRSASANIATGVTTATTSTYFALFKQGALDAINPIFDGNIKINANNTITAFGLTTTAVKRDPTSFHWIHVSNNGLVFDGVNLGAVTTSAITNLRLGYDGTNYADMYGARMCCVSGTSLAYTDFVYFNTEINEWVVKSQSAIKALVDAGGSASFMYEFDNATSLTTLGYDKSSKGNNATLNNFSLTAGTTYDWMLDVPGNSFATLNPLNSGAGAGIANGNLSWANTTTNRATVASSAVTSGKWVWEVTMPGNSTLAGIGLAEKSYITGSYTTLNYASVRGFNGNKLIGTTETAYDASGASSSGTVWRFELDMDGGSLAAFRDGVSKGTLHTWTPGSIAVYPGYLDYDTISAGTTYISFGQAPLHASATYHSAAGGYFRDAPTAGFKALCQANLPTPAILNPSSAVAHRFEAGSGIAAAIASDRSGWSDWMEWFKRTDTTESWKVRFSDDSSNMMAFDTNGTKAAWSAPSTGTYLGTAFKVGATYGVVTGTYSGDSTSNKNISHSLGKAPTCGIVKNESTGTWYVWHTKMTSAAYFTTLNSATPPAQSNTNTPWGTGNWSSTQFMVTNNATNNLNATGSTYRYILFADIDGLLALLGHTGNASTDGAFEYASHKAQLLIEKDLSATTGFYLWSDKIDTYNVTASYLLLNTNAGTAAATGVDICSNAVKYRSATIANASNPYMGISYSRTHGKYSLGR